MKRKEKERNTGRVALCRMMVRKVRTGIILLCAVSMLTGCSNVKEVVEILASRQNIQQNDELNQDTEEMTESEMTESETIEMNTAESEETTEDLQTEDETETEEIQTASEADHKQDVPSGGEPFSPYITSNVDPESYINEEEYGTIRLMDYYGDDHQYNKIYIDHDYDGTYKIYTYNSEEKQRYCYNLDEDRINQIRTLVKQYADQLSQDYDDNHINKKNASGKYLWYMDIETYYYDGDYYNWSRKSYPEDWDTFFEEVKSMVEQGKPTKEFYDPDAFVSELTSADDCAYVYLTKYDLKTDVTICYKVDLREDPYSAIFVYQSNSNYADSYFLGNFAPSKVQQLRQDIYDEAVYIDENFKESRKRSDLGNDGVLWELEIYDQNDDKAYYKCSDYTVLEGWIDFLDGMASKYLTNFTYSIEDARGVW